MLSKGENPLVSPLTIRLGWNASPTSGSCSRSQWGNRERRFPFPELLLTYKAEREGSNIGALGLAEVSQTAT